MNPNPGATPQPTQTYTPAQLAEHQQAWIKYYQAMGYLTAQPTAATTQEAPPGTTPTIQTSTQPTNTYTQEQYIQQMQQWQQYAQYQQQYAAAQAAAVAKSSVTVTPTVGISSAPLVNVANNANSSSAKAPIVYKLGSSRPAYIPINVKNMSAASQSASPMQVDTRSNATATIVKSDSSVSSVKSSTESGGNDVWPQELKDYITKVFKACPEGKRDEVEKSLRVLIQKSSEKNTLLTTDWKNMPLPSACIEDQAAPSPPTKRKKIVASPQLNPKNKKIFDDESSESESDQSTNKYNKMGKSKIKTMSLESLPPEQMKVEYELRNQRLKRFESDDRYSYSSNNRKGGKSSSYSYSSSPRLGSISGSSNVNSRQSREQKIREAALAAGAEGNPDVLDWDPDTIIGTSTELEKRYLRLTSAPDPATVRPLEVLKKTLELLTEKWKAEGNYTYICDQFKSLRQDLTVQRIKNEFTVKVYESHARIALEKKDLGEYNQCQAQLYELYKLGMPGHADEFMAYRILYMVHTKNKTELHQILLSLSDEQKQENSVRHALSVRTAISIGDYHSLFILYNSAPNMSGYIMDHFIDRERAKAMKVICKAYRPTVRLGFLAKELGFVLSVFLEAEKKFKSGGGGGGEEKSEDMEVDGDQVDDWEEGIREGVKECRTWLESLGISLKRPMAKLDVERQREVDELAKEIERLQGLATVIKSAKVVDKRTLHGIEEELKGVKERHVSLKYEQVEEKDLIVDAKESLPVFVSQASVADKVVDIKGQVH